MNHKKLYRLYREEKLMVGRRGGRKRALGTRAPMLLPERLNQGWSLDFIADTLSDGRRFRVHRPTRGNTSTRNSRHDRG
jgi:putative transposase